MIDLSEIKQPLDVIKVFYDESVSDEDIFNETVSKHLLTKYLYLADASGKINLSGDYFLGLNVKTSSSEDLRPISLWSPDNGYKTNPKRIDEGGRIPDMQDPPRDAFFRWDPEKWDKNKDDGASNVETLEEDYNGAVDTQYIANPSVLKFFKHPYGLSYDKTKNEKELRYNILGDIYYNVLGLKGDCWVWLYHFDHDLDDKGKYLSFIMAVCKEKKDIDYIRGSLNDLLSFVMLVKARYVRKLERQRQVESVKSAVAAIMSRNMSHNLGSHYLYYTKAQLIALADKNEVYGPDIRGAAKVLGYMQARMDYLATIVSGDRYPYGSVFFKGQIFDELTIDDFSKRHFVDGKDSDGRERKYKRTTNYLLQNLILSENFTRGPVLETGLNLLAEDNNDEKKRKNIRLQIKTKYGVFTGLPDLAKKEDETKLLISGLSIALPGNVMSIHAFYNVVENLIRNAAKYMKNDFKDELVITIAVSETNPTESQDGLGKSLPACYRFVIYDNKENAFQSYFSKDDTRTLVDQMNHELAGLKILNETNELDKSNKGLKEMLFSTLWMRAYTYDKSERLSDILAQLNRENDIKKKWEEIRQHGFEYVAVDSQGKVFTADDSDAIQVPNPGVPCNLGICFELPKYRMMENVATEELTNNLKGKALNNYTDILCVDANYLNFAYLKSRFTRVHKGFAQNEASGEESVRIMKEILRERFPNFDEYRLCMEGTKESGYDECDKRTRGIYFKTHVADLGTMEKYAYCEAISGENFTKTMQNIFDNSIEVVNDVSKNFLGFGKPKVAIKIKYKNPALEYFALKVKESALTRITLVDERLYNNMMDHKNKAEFLACKNIRVLNLRNMDDRKMTNEDNTLLVDNMFDGNHFRDDVNKNATHFLSIHLGMIEKIVKDDSKWVKERGYEKKSLTERVDLLMQMLRNTFKSPNGELFISVHSGRGNFSKELDESLKEYPFVSISAIESVYANSKFLLTQLFYNTVYIGKGELNEDETNGRGKEGPDA